MSLIQLVGRTALVTGGSRGIGKAVCIALARAGCNLAIGHQSNEKAAHQVLDLVNGMGVKAILVQGNVAHYSEIKSIVSRTLIEFKRIDILVNNAGVWELQPIGEMEENHWHRLIDTNLKSVIGFCNVVIPHMKSLGKGKIINLSSRVARRGAVNSVVYTAAKAGIIGLTRSMAYDVGKYNICVNGVAPGYTETDMTRQFLNDPNRIGDFLKTIPLGRFGTVEDVANTVLFFASDLSDYISGETLFLAGGTI